MTHLREKPQRVKHRRGGLITIEERPEDLVERKHRRLGLAGASWVAILPLLVVGCAAAAEAGREAESHGKPLVIWLDAACRGKIGFVRIPAGTFRMGSETEDDNEKPVHEVTLTKDYWMQTTEVTQAQWAAVMGTNPSHFKGDDRPVESVSWEDCQVFIRKLNESKLKEAGSKTFGLPTEAEWEYACRAGSTGKWCFGDHEWCFGDAKSKLWEYAWLDANSDYQTHPGGQKKPNGWGLYDMHGNVWEWCGDWHGPYSVSRVKDPTGPSSGEFRVIRGGDWISSSWDSRSAYRGFLEPAVRGGRVGLRLVLR